MFLSYKWNQLFHIVIIENLLPIIIAHSIEVCPGPITGISRHDLRASTPESLMVSIQTAEKPSFLAFSPASKIPISARTISDWLM